VPLGLVAESDGNPYSFQAPVLIKSNFHITQKGPNQSVWAFEFKKEL
jgi:hypothetical protein